MKKRTAIALFSVLAALLLGACSGQTGGGDSASAKPDAAEETVTYSVDMIKHFGETDASVWELLQDLLPNYIVYRSGNGKYDYAAIDRSLPQSHYDWTNLVEVGTGSREVEYRVDGETVSIKGIDVSTYQGEIDWEKVASSGVKFAFVRLGYRGYESARLVVDDRFEENIVGAISNGIPCGVYFVTQAISEEEAREEARFVLDTIRPYNITWPIVLDLEDAASASARTALLTQQERTDYTIAFCEEIQAAGYTPMLYCNIRWFIEKLDITRITEYEKWFAQYFRKPFFPYEFQAWQYTSSGRVSGINGDVDLNICFKDYGKKEGE